MRAVIVGTGRVGCGFVGPALRAAGYDLVFVGRNPVVVEHLVTGYEGGVGALPSFMKRRTSPVW